jgi:putative methyltransferase
MKKKIALAQFNYAYGNEYFFPYSVAALWSYVKFSSKIVRDSFDEAEFYFKRDESEKLIIELAKFDIVAFSSYVWNWELNKFLAESIKKLNDKVIVIFGGPQVPDKADNFFLEHPYVNFLVHSEGEKTFTNLLEKYLNEDLLKLLSMNQKEMLRYELVNGTLHGVSINSKSYSRKWTPWPELMSLEKLPSPYLDQTADLILEKNKDVIFQATWETTRGCPYQCTFCDWGSLTLSKLRRFDIERLEHEIEWFSQNKIDFVFGADANFGILERDEKIAESLSKSKILSGFPKKFRVSYAKNSTERVLRIAETLNSVGMDKGITLSVQSMDMDVLEEIKRKNLKIGDLKKFVEEYRRKKIATYTEVIMGLPGETRETFKAGITKLLKAGVHDALSIYNCGILPNAELNSQEQKSLHEIKSIRTPIFMNHSTPKNEKIIEYEEIIISTKSMSVDDWKWMYSFSWAIQSFHTLNLTQLISVVLEKYFGITYENFYESLLEEAANSPDSFLGNLYNSYVIRQFEKVFSGGEWGFVLPEFSDVVWSSEEATFLIVSESKENFFNDLRSFILSKFSSQISLLYNPEEFVEDLIKVQQFILLDWKQFSDELVVKFNVYDCWLGIINNKEVQLQKSIFSLTKNNLNVNIEDKKIFAKEIVWFGRKGGKHVHSDIQSINLNKQYALN